MDKITHEIRLKQWTSIIQECHSSGMTVRAWCLENNVSDKKFYYWQRRLREKAYNAIEKQESNKPTNFVQLPVSASVDSPKNPTSFTADMVVHIGNNVLELSNTVSEELLSRVLKVISDVK